MFLEEAKLDYESDTTRDPEGRSAQAGTSEDHKAPAIVDDGVAIFDSNAILLHLGRQTGNFMPGASPQNDAALLSWMTFIATGVGPYSGQSVHFQLHPRGTFEYAVER